MTRKPLNYFVVVGIVDHRGVFDVLADDIDSGIRIRNATCRDSNYFRVSHNTRKLIWNLLHYGRSPVDPYQVPPILKVNRNDGVAVKVLHEITKTSRLTHMFNPNAEY